MIYELSTQLWVETPKGPMLARFLIFNGLDHDVVFLCEAEANGAFWMWRGPEVRGQRNHTLGLGRRFPARVDRQDFDPDHLSDPERPSSPHDWIWIGSLAVTVYNAWQNKSIQNAILQLKLDLVDRIAKCEGDIKALMARNDH